jgi:hypothetical protein
LKSSRVLDVVRTIEPMRCRLALERKRLKLAFELGSTKWTLGLTALTTPPAQRARVRTIAGALVALEQEIVLAKTRFGLTLRGTAVTNSGGTAFWVHRWFDCGAWRTWWWSRRASK